jgi:hypothetical protein
VTEGLVSHQALDDEDHGAELGCTYSLNPEVTLSNHRLMSKEMWFLLCAIENE